MSRFLFTVLPEKGHLNPMIPVAQHLTAARHDVAFHAPADISEQLSRAGLDRFLGDHTSPTGNHGARFAERVRDPKWLRGWIRAMLIDAVSDRVATYRHLIADWRPDVVVTDPMLYAAVIAAHTCGRPWVAMSNSLNPILDPTVDSELLQTVTELAPDRDRLFAEHGAAEVRFRGCDALSPHLTTCFATPSFAGGEVPGVELVGPSLAHGPRGDETPFPWERLRTGRAVYVSFGSQVYHQPARFSALLEAANDLDVQLVLSVSDLDIDAPAGTIVVPYAPQLELLQRVELLITHGGANSVMEALVAGVPIAVAPICNDQFHQVHFVTKAGVGAELPLDNASIGALRMALAAMLSNGEMRAASKKMARDYAVDGAARAAKLAEHLARHA